MNSPRRDPVDCSRRRRSGGAAAGFTLVELLLVVVILGILAAIVVPQFGDSTKDSKESALISQLAVVRKQIELYRVHHNGQPPTLGDFTAQMTGKTHPDGSPGGDLGPYLNEIPINPFTDEASIGTGGIGSSSWHYDASSGRFRANCHEGHSLL